MYKWEIINMHTLWTNYIYILLSFIRVVCVCRAVTKGNFILKFAIAIAIFNDIASSVLWWYLVYDICIYLKDGKQRWTCKSLLEGYEYYMTCLLSVIRGKFMTGTDGTLRLIVYSPPHGIWTWFRLCYILLWLNTEWFYPYLIGLLSGIGEMLVKTR